MLAQAFDRTERLQQELDILTESVPCWLELTEQQRSAHISRFKVNLATSLVVWSLAPSLLAAHVPLVAQAPPRADDCLSFVEHLRARQFAGEMTAVAAVASTLPAELDDDLCPLSVEDVAFIAQLGTGVVVAGAAVAALHVVHRAESDAFSAELERLRCAVPVECSAGVLRLRFVRAKAVEVVLILGERFRDMEADSHAVKRIAGSSHARM